MKYHAGETEFNRCDLNHNNNNNNYNKIMGLTGDSVLKV